jgi:hypothetical protein
MRFTFSSVHLFCFPLIDFKPIDTFIKFSIEIMPFTVTSTLYSLIPDLQLFKNDGHSNILE